MNRITGAAQNRRRNRQGPLEGGRSRARSVVPVVVLGTCMVAVLYGNVSYYSDSLHDRRSSAGPTEGSAPVAQNLQVQSEPLRDTPAEEERGNGPGDAADVPLTSKASSSSKKALLPEEGQLPEPPPATSAAEATEGAVEGGEGEGDWSDDAEAGEGESGAGNGVHSLTVGGGSVAAGAAEPGTDAGVDEGEGAEGGGEPGQSRTEPDGGSEHQEKGEEDRTEEARSNLLDDMFASEEAAGAGAAAAAAAAAKLDAGRSEEAVSNLLDDRFASEEAAAAGASAAAAAAAKLDAAGTSDGERNSEEKKPQTTDGDVGDAADDARSESTRGAGSQGEGGTADSASARGDGERGGGIDGEQDQDGLGPGAEDWGGEMADGAETGSASFRDELFGEGQQRATAAAVSSSSSRRPDELPSGGGEGGADVGSHEQQQVVVDSTDRRDLLSRPGGDGDQRQEPQGTVGVAPQRLLQLEDIPDPQQQQLLQAEADGVPAALVQPGGEGDQQQHPVWEEQQQQQEQQEPEDVEPPAWMAELESATLEQPGGERNQQQEPIWEEQQPRQEQQQGVDIAPEGLLQPGVLPDLQQHQQEQGEGNGVPAALAQPGGEGDQQQQPVWEKQQQQQDQQEPEDVEVPAWMVKLEPVALEQPGGEGDQQQQPVWEEQQQQQEQQQGVDIAPEGLLQPGVLPDLQQHQQDHGEGNGVPAALAQPGGEGDQQQQPVWEEQQQQQDQQEPEDVEVPAWMAELESATLEQTGGEGDQQQQPVWEEQQQQQQQEQQEPEDVEPPAWMVELESATLVNPGGEGNQQQEPMLDNQQPQQEQQQRVDTAPEGLSEPWELPDPQQHRQEQGEGNGVPTALVQPGGEGDQQQQQPQQPVDIAPQVLLQPGELLDTQHRQEAEENRVRESLVQPGGKGDEQQQPVRDEQEQEQEQEQQQPVGVVPQGLLQPGDLPDSQQRRLQLQQAEGGGVPEPLVQPGGEGDQQHQPVREGQQQQQQQPIGPARQSLLQPGDISDTQHQEQEQQPQQRQQQQKESEESREDLPQIEVRGDEGGAPAVAAVAEPPVVRAPNGAAPGAMECAMTKLGEGVDDITNIATWREVPGDATYRHPLAEENGRKYVTLQKDLGGFNNIRLSLECAVAIAAATGRTLVIPPPFQIWNMQGTAKKEVDLRELFSFDKLRASGRVSVITTAEFLEREAVTGNLGVQPDKNVMLLDVKAVEAYMEQVASQYDGGLPELSVERAALVMPRRIDGKVDLEDESYGFAKKWIYGRELLEYQGQPWEEAKVIHWRAKESRLLAPFYAFVLHADEASDQYHKRLLRDLVHYPEEVYCKASQIISLLRQEDPSGDFSTFHVRRNDFIGVYKMVNLPLADVIANSLVRNRANLTAAKRNDFGKAYKSVMIDPADVIANSLDHLNDNEVVYVATDEKDLSVFEPFKKNVRVKFLSDYYERAGVSELNPNLIGMLEQVVASHGRTFTGCWLSTFTAYILRLRGHLQMPRKSNWSYFNPRKEYNQAYKLPENPLWMTEWPFGWERIDETGVPDPMAP